MNLSIGRSGTIKMFILLCKVMVWNISIIGLKNTETLIERIELSELVTPFHSVFFFRRFHKVFTEK